MIAKTWIRAYAVSLAAVGAAVVVRWAARPWLGDYVPLATMYGAVAIAVWIAGYRAAVIAALLGYSAISWLIVPPTGEIEFLAAPRVIAFALYALSCALIIAIGEAVRRERKRAQIASAQFHIVTETMAAAVTRCSRDMRYLWVNKQYCDWIKLPEEELVGRPIVDVVGAEAFEQLLPYFGRVLAGETVHYEKEVAFRNIGPCWISVTYSPTRDDDGEVDGWVAVVQDVTERREADAERQRSARRIQADYEALTRLREVADLTGASDSSFDDCLLAFLDAAIAVTGAEKGNVQLLDRDTHTLRLAASRRFDEPFLNFFATVDSSTAASCGVAIEHRTRVIVEDVTTSPIFRGTPSLDVLLAAGVRSVQSTPLLTSRGQLLGMMSTHDSKPRSFDERSLRWMDILARQTADFVERKHAEDALVLATANLREADRRKDEFLAMLSHELRNPLAPIGYAAQILNKDDPTRAQIRKVRDVIARQVRQMGRLLDDLIDVSRITRGTISLRKQPVELSALMSDAVDASRPLIEQSGHVLDIHIPQEPIVVYADPARVTQVLMNLLNNAAKYTESGGRIELRATREDDSAVIRVRDTGIGIPAHMLGRIFELFTQEERSIERARGGLGIGLALARQLVTLHGGELEAHSDGPGRGSEFVVRLPLAQEPHAGIARIASEGTPLQPLRILVVDDNEDAAESMANLLSGSGHEVRMAGDGFAAVETAATFQPDAVVMDIGMPGLNGYEAAQRIRAQRGVEVVLVAVTGWGQEEDRRRARAAGFDHHLTKPVDLAQLSRLLSTAGVAARQR
jgi:PAS domain S-box-containing protein